jgi:cell division protein FtsB
VILIRRTGKRSGGRITPFPRRKQRSYGISRLITMAGAILLCFLIAVVVVQMFQYNRLRKELESAELRVDEYESRNEKVTEEIARLHEPGYIEMLARKLLGLVRPGEIVFQLED